MPGHECDGSQPVSPNYSTPMHAPNMSNVASDRIHEGDGAPRTLLRKPIAKPHMHASAAHAAHPHRREPGTPAGHRSQSHGSIPSPLLLAAAEGQRRSQSRSEKLWQTSLPEHHHKRVSSDSFLPPRRVQEASPVLEYQDWSNRDTQGIREEDELQAAMAPALQYHHMSFNDTSRKKPENRTSQATLVSQNSDSHGSSSSSGPASSQLLKPDAPSGRPASPYTTGSENSRPRSHSPHLSVEYPTPSQSPVSSGHGVRKDSRPLSYIDLLNTPYAQQIAPAPNFNNAALQNSVGGLASLLDTKKTFEMYRANVKKTNDPAVQYEFAVFMVQLAQDSPQPDPELLREGRGILQKLADRSYPFAQYYLGDGYASGLFNKGKEDQDRAFPLFVAASKHGHAEAGYRAALCYEFGWGCRKDYAKAVQFYRQSASRGHPGAATRLGLACLQGAMGFDPKRNYREGVKWLKRAAENADMQYNSAPYELGLLHVTGYGDDVFKDEGYAAQLFTQSADLCHAEANWRMGEAYEHGLLTCPKDPALSVHFYNGAAQAGHPRAMMALCAWYLVGAEPILDRDEGEAYEWAKKAAETGYPKAEYAVGYFTEMGIGCRRDPLEANVWYVRAADAGDERAKQRLAIIRAAASGDPISPPGHDEKPWKKRSVLSKKGGASTEEKEEEEKECIIM